MAIDNYFVFLYHLQENHLDLRFHLDEKKIKWYYFKLIDQYID